MRNMQIGQVSKCPLDGLVCLTKKHDIARTIDRNCDIYVGEINNIPSSYSILLYFPYSDSYCC